MPGSLIDGHHQIALACDRCHTPFGGVSQEACLDCHEAELETARDSHPEDKFADPRNAALLVRLDARRCVACHTEHRPEITGVMGVTLPGDFCHHCHADIARERPTHQGLSFETCASSGCHNYHDNRALYEDFLVRHGAAAPATLPATLPERDAWISRKGFERAALTAADADGPAASSPELTSAWGGFRPRRRRGLVLPLSPKRRCSLGRPPGAPGVPRVSRTGIPGVRGREATACDGSSASIRCRRPRRACP